MDYAAVSVPAAPVRRKPRHNKEMVNQLLFGEAVQILKTKGDLWVKIRSLHDGYEGWMTHTMLEEIDEKSAGRKSNYITADMMSAVSFGEKRVYVPAGSSLPMFGDGKGKLGKLDYSFDGNVIDLATQKPGAEKLRQLALAWLHVPYMWGGRTPLGIDCSGLVQVVFKLMGIDLPRDAWQQAQEGKVVKKLSEAQAGDLAFFNDKETIVHTGILLNEQQIIHASGKVRIDSIDKKGIVNSETGKRTYKLEAIRRLW